MVAAVIGSLVVNILFQQTLIKKHDNCNSKLFRHPPPNELVVYLRFGAGSREPLGKNMASLLKKLCTRKLLRKAWDNIRHRSESKGIDEETIEEFENNLKFNLDLIRKQLLEQKYDFQKLRGYPLKQEEKKPPRPLRIPAVRDRVVQKAIELTIRPFLEKKYAINNPLSYAYIKGRSVKQAAEKVRDLYKEGKKWVYEADIEKFFDSVNKDKLLSDFIFPSLPDSSINSLIQGAITAELGNRAELERIGVSEIFPPDGSGIPQGGILSPLFANVYLSPLDDVMMKYKMDMVRYADDFIVMCKTEQDAKNADALARGIVEGQLGLKIYPITAAAGKKRSTIGPFQNIVFLGLLFQGDKIYPSPKNVSKIVTTISGIPVEYRSDTLVKALTSIRSRIKTWAATYFYTDITKPTCADFKNRIYDAVVKLLKNHGLRPIKRTIDLMRLGVPNFSDEIEFFRKREIEKKSKENQ